MKDINLIENRLYEWAEALRITGNEAAHDINKKISKQDAKDIIDFTDAILEYVFTFRKKLDEFLARRKAVWEYLYQNLRTLFLGVNVNKVIA